MADDRRIRLRDGLDGALTNLMAVLPGADNEPGWELLTSDDGWNVRQLLAHVMIAEGSMNLLIGKALEARTAGAAAETLINTGPDGTPFDIDRWNARQIEKRTNLPASALRNELSEVRTITLKTLAATPEELLETPAWHPVIGMTTIDGIYRIMAIHMKDHTRAMKVALKSGMKGRYWAE